ncbi:uncharacterized protein Z520_07261 [Fonsecaea multimorphosa CBS 102226]|uniref:Zn(2)-C6 fungal-type domain-containing protein n=1 Tax=Fonsecaea multimorphosa CBS 102226 TaxID=1442371 RepID=A0A0D2JUJ4_9EURO|nr:uncharacterized protein Z520_07261 [Fonsecaea multimorphosa CBS 102226]KIX97147.1 hypothetical protein Z520_07261 [Fonsecaea multimorphosa CBS 102226]
MQQAATVDDSSRRRRFKIRSEFGLARQWRSRKNRPCDACRRRRSACVIEDRPPCLFCRGRGLDCQSTSQPRTARQSGLQEPDPNDEQLDTLESLAESHLGEDRVLEMQASPGDADGHHLLSSPNSHRGNAEMQSRLSSVHPRPQSSSDVHVLETKVHTLEDGQDLTAHCMGLSAEQDTHLLASFRSVIINETNRVDGDIIQVHPGNPATGTPPLHFTILRDWFMPYDDRIKHESSQEIEFKVGPHGPGLVRLYFKHVHPVYCVVSKVRFLRAYKEDKLSIPASLRGVVYGMGAVYWKQDPILRTLHRPFEQYELFQAAQASLERELDAPNLWKLQACLLMIHEKAAGNGTFETPRTWTLSAQAVACAQMIGLHRDPNHWKIAPWEKSLRKKLWWATYVTDMWASVSHGNPFLLHATSYTTSNLDMDDMRFDEDVPEDLKDMVDVASASFDVSTAARFLELVKLTQILHNLLDTAFSDHAYRAAMLDLASQESRLLNIQRDLESWHSLMPLCVTMNYNTTRSEFRNNAPLHLAYFATQILLFRALMTPASMAAKNNPLSSLRRFFGAAIEQLRAFLDFMNEITLEGLQAFWGRRKSSYGRSQLILIGNFLIHLFLLSSNPEQVSGTFRLLEHFHESLQRIGELVDEESVGLIRPVALRIDSFFTQAAQIMRRGLATGSYAEARMGETPP